MKEYIEAGKIVTTHGVRGEVKAEPWCDEPAFLAGRKRLHLGTVGNPVEVESGRVHKGMVLLKFKGVDTVEAGAALRGKVLYVHRDEIPLGEGEHLIQDIIGLQVFDADSGERYGELCDVTHTGANDVYHIRFPDGKERLIPAIPQVIVKIDVMGGRMDIRPLEGLFEE
ncbi:MAG: 16S rRNA processing protein RimM [Clostridiales bacterium]|uniref:ribosome maturation factor RimM n=1 Tax=Provencibacterium massiliense TaxID=1841868 RepID=UPI0009A85736|nr:ribosome maturation factor RimM [Provencibacterium massiliense]PWM35011.1 MAG: 16S rRNA processing protein RimM [Clostridiales bacterium]RGB68669.1 16S rRNA processing protein RimM [Harryflintia acetispora]